MGQTFDKRAAGRPCPYSSLPDFKLPGDLVHANKIHAFLSALISSSSRLCVWLGGGGGGVVGARSWGDGGDGGGNQILI